MSGGFKLTDVAITPTCRANRGIEGAWDEAVARLRQVFDVQLERFPDETFTLQFVRGNAINPATAPSTGDGRCENCDLEEMSRSCRHELEGEALEQMERLGFEIVTHREDEGGCFSCSLGRMLDRLATWDGRATVFVDELRHWIGERRDDYDDEPEILAALDSLLDERAVAPSSSSGESGGSNVFARDECTFHYCPQPAGCVERCAAPYRGSREAEQ